MSKEFHISTCSYGNDSIALIQFLINEGLDFAVLYNNTGWASDDWIYRVNEVNENLDLLEIPHYETQSEGMINLVKRKKGWPMPASNMQWCTQYLKEKPSNIFYESHDPECNFIVVTGRRREESQNRANLSIHEHNSEKHNGRDVWNPLALHDEQMRNDLIDQFGVEILPHSSRECWPCVCENREGLCQLSQDERRIDLIEVTEIEMGHTKNKKPRVMFRPYRHGDGVGIRQVIDWAKGGRGYKSLSMPDIYKYNEMNFDLFDGIHDEIYESTLENKRQCDGGFCGN